LLQRNDDVSNVKDKIVKKCIFMLFELNTGFEHGMVYLRAQLKCSDNKRQTFLNLRCTIALCWFPGSTTFLLQIIIFWIIISWFDYHLLLEFPGSVLCILIWYSEHSLSFVIIFPPFYLFSFPPHFNFKT
jgi:hypothetical protein